MNISKAPVGDLMKYFHELYWTHPNRMYKSLLSIIEDHYELLTGYDIHTPNNLVFLNWCFGDRNLMDGYDINSFPEAEGLLLYNSKTKVYGLSF